MWSASACRSFKFREGMEGTKRNRSHYTHVSSLCWQVGENANDECSEASSSSEEQRNIPATAAISMHYVSKWAKMQTTATLQGLKWRRCPKGTYIMLFTCKFKSLYFLHLIYLGTQERHTSRSYWPSNSVSSQPKHRPHGKGGCLAGQVPAQWAKQQYLQ